MCDGCKISNAPKRLSQACVHFVTTRASLFTDHRISGLPKRAKYRIQNNLWAYLWQFSNRFHFSFFEVVVIDAWSRYFVEPERHLTTICEQTVDNSPTDPISSSPNWWSSFHGVATLSYCSVVLFASSQYLSTHFLPFRHQVCPWLFCFWYFFCSLGRNPWDEQTSVIIHNILADLTFSLSANPNKHGHEWCWFSQIDFFHEYFPHRINVLFLSSLMSSTYTDKNNPFSRCTNKHSQFGTFSQPYFNRIFSNCLSHNSPAEGWPYKFRSRGTTGLPYWNMILDICASVDVSKYLDILTLEFLNNDGASSILTWV